MTNLERIRNMNAEELAEEITFIVSGYRCDTNNRVFIGVKRNIKAWLESEVKSEVEDEQKTKK